MKKSTSSEKAKVPRYVNPCTLLRSSAKYQQQVKTLAFETFTRYNLKPMFEAHIRERFGDAKPDQSHIDYLMSLIPLNYDDLFGVRDKLVYGGFYRLANKILTKTNSYDPDDTYYEKDRKMYEFVRDCIFMEPSVKHEMYEAVSSFASQYLTEINQNYYTYTEITNARAELGFLVNDPTSKEDINKAFRKLSIIYHPDKGGSVEMQQRLSNARDILIHAFENNLL